MSDSVSSNSQTISPRTPQSRSTPKVYQHSPYGFRAIELPPSVSPTGHMTDPLLGVSTNARRSSVNSTSSGGETPSEATPKSASHALHINVEVPPVVISTHSVGEKSYGPATATSNTTAMRVPSNRLFDHEGSYFEMSFTAHGSSFLQAALRRASPDMVAMVWDELHDRFPVMLVDIHAAYVVKILLEKSSQAAQCIFELSNNASLITYLAVTSLHTRRMVQFLAESGDITPFFNLIMTQARAIAFTVQGCITIQRILDHCTPQMKELFFDMVRYHMVEYSCDAHANYVVQYMLQHGNTKANSDALALRFSGFMKYLACDKYASNIVEHGVHAASSTVQQQLINELFAGEYCELRALLMDAIGNYTVQAVINFAPHRMIGALAQRLTGLLSDIPHGKKMEARIMRRMQGKVEGHPQQLRTAAPTPIAA